MKLKKAAPVERRRVASGQRRSSLNYYRSKPAASEAPKSKPPKKGFGRRLVSKASESLFLLVILAAIIFSLLVKPSPTVTLNNELYHSSSTYQQSLSHILGGFWFRNKITFNEGKLSQKLQQQYPEVVSAETHLPLISQKPSIVITVARPNFKLLSRGVTYLIGQQGIAITDQAPESILKKLPVIEDKSGYKIAIGKPALDSSAVTFINSLLAQLKNANVPVAHISLPATAKEADLQTKDHAYYTKFYLGGDVLVQAGEFLAARQHFHATGQSPKQYLDVRVEGKVFFR